MYAIHTTPGFVISSRPYGETGKLLVIFTEEFGLVRVSALGIRVERSKLRPFVQDYARGLFSLVRGKEYWRLTNAQELMAQREVNCTVGGTGIDSLVSRELVARIALLLGRLLQGEEANPALFAVLRHLFIYLDEHVSVLEVQTLESLIVIRILHRLGHVPLIKGLELEIAADEVSGLLIERCLPQRVNINQHINKALHESQL